MQLLQELFVGGYCVPHNTHCFLHYYHRYEIYMKFTCTIDTVHMVLSRCTHLPYVRPTPHKQNIYIHTQIYPTRSAGIYYSRILQPDYLSLCCQCIHMKFTYVTYSTYSTCSQYSTYSTYSTYSHIQSHIVTYSHIQSHIVHIVTYSTNAIRQSPSV